MSKTPKARVIGKAEKQAAPPDVPAIYCNFYRYNIDAHGQVTIWAGMSGHHQVAISFPMAVAIDLHQKLGNTIADVLRPKADAPAPNGKIEPPSPEEAKP